MRDSLFFAGRGDGYTQLAHAGVGGRALAYLSYTGPEPPDGPAAYAALALAYRSEILLRYAAWAAHSAQPPAPGEAFTPAPLAFTELRLWLPHFYYDEDEGLPSAEPTFHDLRTRLVQWRDLILLGPPGSGKTTALWQLAQGLALEGLEADPDTPLPILVDLSCRQPSQDGATLLRDALEQVALLDPEGRPQPLAAHQIMARLLPGLLAERRLVLLWDGLDEVPRGLAGATSSAIEALRHSAITRILNIVSCRADSYSAIQPYTGGLHVTLKQAAIEPLDTPASQALILQRLGDRHGQTLLAALEQRAEAVPAALTRSPLLLSMLCDVFQANRTLPASQGRLIEAFVAARLAALAQPDAEALVRALARLAYALTASYGRGTAAPLDWALQQLGEGAPSAEPARLALLASRAGLLALVRSGAALRFSHALVQEYFAALALRDQLSGQAQPPGAQPAGQLKRYPETNWQQGWEETLLLLGSLRAEPGPIEQRVRDGLSADPLLAARLLAGSAGGADPELAVLLRSIALEQIGDSAGHARRRVAAGQALGLVGDPRAPATLEEWRSELGRAARRFGRHNTYWCYVQPGSYQIGAWKPGQPGEELALDGFWIGRLPVTVAQFSAFAGTGYAEGAQRWWTRAGWAWRQARARVAPEHWDEPAYTASNQPVVGVSWYEAAAFCAWLSEQLRDALPPGHVVRLPSEAEWEAAAAFDGQLRRHAYPWGSHGPTPDHAIYSEAGLATPAPAGCCPAGAAHCGALDLLGNIEEWCASWFGAYPAGSHVPAEEPPSGNNILLGPLTGNQLAARGGWWAHQAAQLSCGSRFWYYASAASHTIGFRVVLAAPLAPGR